jgi:hypothetical protein
MAPRPSPSLSVRLERRLKRYLPQRRLRRLLWPLDLWGARRSVLRETTFVFVCGLHRSGTSVLTAVLRAHPEVRGLRGTGVNRNEGQFVQTVFPPGYAYGGPGRFGFHLAAHLDESSPLVSRWHAWKLFAQWGRYWGPDARVVLEKSPPNIVRSRFFQALFPDTRFLGILRHPVAVAYATQRWTRGESLESLVEHWLVCHERFAADLPRLEHALVFRYEEFALAPQAWYDRVCDFLGIAPAKLEKAIEPNTNEKYLRRWEEARQSPERREEVERIIARFEERVNAFGYSLHDVGARELARGRP